MYNEPNLLLKENKLNPKKIWKVSSLYDKTQLVSLIKVM